MVGRTVIRWIGRLGFARRCAIGVRTRVQCTVLTVRMRMSVSMIVAMVVLMTMMGGDRCGRDIRSVLVDLAAMGMGVRYRIVIMHDGRTKRDGEVNHRRSQCTQYSDVFTPGHRSSPTRQP